jgi:hypothetical protein
MLIFGGFSDKYENDILIYNFVKERFTKIKPKGLTPPAMSNM